MADYEQLRQRHVADAMAMAPKLIERLGWSADRLAAHRAAELRELVRVAVERSAWHRKRLEGVNPDAVEEASLGELPVMTKADLMEHFDEIVTDDRLRLDLVEDHLDRLPGAGYLLDRYTAIASAGSSGRRGVFIYDWKAWAVLCVSSWRDLLAVADSNGDRTGEPPVRASVAAGHPMHATAAISRTFSGPNLPSVYYPVTLPTEEIVAGLNETQPTYLFGYPSALYGLVPEVTSGRLRISPQRVTTAGEPLLPEIRRALEEAWGVRVGNKWAASEGGGLGVPCEQRATHLSDDLFIIEPVDELGRPVRPGDRSAKVYLTNLYNLTLPLIRYELTDEVTVLPDPCACGQASRCISDIQGRLDDTFVYQSLRVHPHVFRSPLGRRANIVEYQVRQTLRGADIAVRCEGPVDLQALKLEVESALARLGLDQPQVTVRTPERLERQGTGKLKHFVPLPR